MNSLSVKRFLSKIAIGDDCWEWQAYVEPHGYGRFLIHVGKNEQAHRVAWNIFNGSIPPKQYILHRCDNRRCVNPAHLFLGSYKDNSDDKIKKGRHTSYKVSQSDRLRIREEYVSGITQSDLGKKYGLDQSQISRIVNMTGGVKELQLKGILCP